MAHILEGSVQRIANKVRVNAQLIDARNDAHLWAQTYTRDLADVFGIQSEIAEAIAQQLQAHLSADEKARMAKPSTTDPVAYDLYLRARQLDDLTNDPDAKEATYFRASASWRKRFGAIRNSCVRTVSCAKLISIYIGVELIILISGANWPESLCKKPKRSSRMRGKSTAQKGLYAYHGFRDYDGALKELEKAKELLPNEARIYVTIGAIDRRIARLQEAETNFRRAVELDPRNFLVLMEAASTFSGMRRYAEARHFFEMALNILPNNPFARFLFGFNSFGQTGDVASVRKQLDLVAQQSPEAERSVAFPLLLLQLDAAGSSRSRKGSRTDSGGRHRQQLR